MAGRPKMAALTLYVVTFNCGLRPIDTETFASQLFTGLHSTNLPDHLVLSLQEIAPLPLALIGGSFLVPFFEKFYHAVQKGSRTYANAADNGPTYAPIAARNLGMTGIMVFAKDPSRIQDIETGGVGVGLWEMGNKGAVAIRFTYHQGSASTELTFVAAHLAAMEWELQRRNEDWKNIVRGLVFSSTTSKRKTGSASLSGEERPLLHISPHDASIYKPTSHLFVAGDLNYRTSVLSPSPTDHIDIFPQPHHPPDSSLHFSSLFESDQLNQERFAGRTLHGLTEAEIAFPPTYKYNSEEPFLTPDDKLKKWPWARHRWPSWCDRILYLPLPTWVTRSQPLLSITTHKYTALPLFPTSDHRAVTLEISVPIVPIPPPKDEEGDDPRIKPPFEINVDWKRKRERARQLELVVGFALYFTTTKEGGTVAAAVLVGVVGAYFAIRAMVEM
jgi:hypothetical protein